MRRPTPMLAACEAARVAFALALFAIPAAQAADVEAPTQCPAQVDSIALTPQSAVRELNKAPRYTQGLLVHDGRLYESAGMFGHSGVYALAMDGKDLSRLTTLDDSRFGEGLAILDGKAYNLTWRSQQAYVYDIQADGNFEATDPATLSYDGEGWGLTPYDGQLLLSDGTATMRLVDPSDFSVTREIAVLAGKRPVTGLNELEAVGDHVLANLYGPPIILAIDVGTGCVTLAIDGSPLAKAVRPVLSTGPDAICGSFGCTAGDYVLNGIAYEAERDEIYVTGKNWPTIYVFANPLASRR